MQPGSRQLGSHHLCLWELARRQSYRLRYVRWRQKQSGQSGLSEVVLLARRGLATLAASGEAFCRFNLCATQSYGGIR